VRQTAQRIGLAVGQAVIGASFFAALPVGVQLLHGTARQDAFGHALGTAVLVGLGFVSLAVLVGVVDLRVTRRRVRKAHAGESSGAPDSDA
jgi:F0F1-type ATP synthase membrane subunit c/vacuolar-type H+-ATPase subunit K